MPSWRPVARPWRPSRTGRGTFCIRDAAKTLQVTETTLTAYLSGNDWIYRREPGGLWVATARRFGQGWITTKATPVDIGNGKVWNKPQARITSAGLTIWRCTWASPCRRASRPAPTDRKRGPAAGRQVTWRM